VRIYYASDVHGSEVCWRKFLAAPKFYGADVAIMGGDITGKFVVPIIRHADGSAEATFIGTKRRLKKEKDLERFKGQVANSGSYYFETTQEEFEEYQADPSQVGGIFEKLILERVEHWVQLADTQLPGQNVKCFVAAGNDDFYAVDDILAKAKSFEVHDGRVVELGDGFEMLGLGYSNMTPWHCERDISEEELAAKIEALAGQIKNMKRAIFDIHVPPYGTEIDSAPELTEDLQVVTSISGEPIMVPVGSTAVREAIERYQPLLGLHGHIHESWGVQKLGTTTLVNPGSEYAEGILRGALIDLDAQEGILKTQIVGG
jgi:Icc-related predicted phosphoesterase